MKIFIAGSGKLAKAILNSGLSFPSCEVLPWESRYHALSERAIIVHAGSGRQLKECVDFCRRTGSVFIELSTGLETEKMEADFTLIICPNTSILVLKLLNLIRMHGNYFSNYDISITESHQASKTSAPGTAYSFADSLNIPHEKVRSVRQPELQEKEIGIPEEYLGKHAYHKIIVKDGTDEITFETKVLGHDSYSKGVKKIIEAVLNHSFARRRYSVFDLIDQNML